MPINESSSLGPLRGRFPQELRPLEEVKQRGLERPDRPTIGHPEDIETEGTFKESLRNLVNDVDHMQKTAEETTHRMLTGELEDVHQVMIAMEEAQTSFQLMMEIRNKIVEAYKEVIRMQV